MNESIRPLFIFSLPRSGSTLLQRMLATHDLIASTAETWLMLPYAYTLKDKGVVSTFSHQLMVKAVRNFCKELPGGEEEYLDRIGQFMLGLYSSASQENSVYFLDKTPRYGLIAEQIVRIFPNGKFIFLWRNPLGTISSMLSLWDNPYWLYPFKWDLYDSLENLIATYQNNSDRVCTIGYDQLLTSPEQELKKVTDYLGLPWQQKMIADFSNVNLNGGDPTGVKNYMKLSLEPLQKWKQVLNNPIRKAWCKNYLKWIGAERMKVMGYDFNQIIDELNGIQSQPHSILSDIKKICMGSLYLRVRQSLLDGKFNRL